VAAKDDRWWMDCHAQPGWLDSICFCICLCLFFSFSRMPTTQLLLSQTPSSLLVCITRLVFFYFVNRPKKLNGAGNFFCST
jgi:Mn2+/Fe2+ NRAMP family transporter